MPPAISVDDMWMWLKKRRFTPPKPVGCASVPVLHPVRVHDHLPDRSADHSDSCSVAFLLFCHQPVSPAGESVLLVLAVVSTVLLLLLHQRPSVVLHIQTVLALSPANSVLI